MSGKNSKDYNLGFQFLSKEIPEVVHQPSGAQLY
jgi:hypothetical protein